MIFNKSFYFSLRFSFSPTSGDFKKKGQNSILYPMSVQSVKKRNGCTLATAHKKIQHTLVGAEKSVKYRVWPGRNKAYFYNTICRETQNSPAKVFTKSAGLPAKRRPLRFFTPRPNIARKFSSCRSDKGYSDLNE